MPHTSRSLAFRDPAIAALVGAVDGSDFGQDFGDDFGDDFGADLPAPITTGPVPAPTQSEALALWKKTKTAEMRVANRIHALDPNKDSPIKVEGFIFTVDEPQTWGTAALINLAASPSTTFRPQRLCSNVPMAGIATFRGIQVSNVNAIVGPGVVDAFCFSPFGVDVRMSLPTLSPALRVQISGNWSTFLPPFYVLGTAFTHTASFFGPARLSG